MRKFRCKIKDLSIKDKHGNEICKYDVHYNNEGQSFAKIQDRYVYTKELITPSNKLDFTKDMIIDKDSPKKVEKCEFKYYGEKLENLPLPLLTIDGKEYLPDWLETIEVESYKGFVKGEDYWIHLANGVYDEKPYVKYWNFECGNEDKYNVNNGIVYKTEEEVQRKDEIFKLIEKYRWYPSKTEFEDLSEKYKIFVDVITKKLDYSIYYYCFFGNIFFKTKEDVKKVISQITYDEYLKYVLNIVD